MFDKPTNFQKFKNFYSKDIYSLYFNKDTLTKYIFVSVNTF